MPNARQVPSFPVNHCQDTDELENARRLLEKIENGTIYFLNALAEGLFALRELGTYRCE